MVFHAGVSGTLSECSPLLGRKPESLASENSFVTHLCHPAHTLGGPWRNWILARQCNGIVPGDGCDAGSAWRGGRRARRRCPIARAGLHLQPVRRSIYLPRCRCRSSSSNGFVIGLRFSYISGNAVTSPRRSLHNLPGISPLRLCNASSKCSNLLFELGFADCNILATFWSFINSLIYILRCIHKKKGSCWILLDTWIINEVD